MSNDTVSIRFEDGPAAGRMAQLERGCEEVIVPFLSWMHEEVWTGRKEPVPDGHICWCTYRIDGAIATLDRLSR